MKIIDTHQHLIYPDRFRYSWTASVPALHGKPFRLEEYRAAAARTGIAETLFMEVDVDEVNIRSEAAFFLQMADDPVNRMPGVIAACRPEHPGFAAELEAILHPKLKGLRRVLHTGPDELSQQPLFAENIARLEEHRLTFDLCLLSRQLPLGKTLLRTIPDVQFVLDHCGIPDIRGGGLDPWRQHIRDLAAFPNLVCKISGVVAYCDPQRVTVEQIRPYVEHCIECFGWDRVLFGGDWPVCNITSSLGQWVTILKEIVAGESEERQQKLFAANAERVYRLKP
ncbi:MAG TPA: amidohydrolase family protein [Verrucomicrobia bacterium]|nr:amidohydrolase family protein [Verrucomicrobiota bacterium]HOB31744.1 amidohydrolase [Verrucomicrobiota bacterium]HOP98782.1 amidohydrolase [Verrucomicrobiota bacterium]HPU57777.1 amidohydrolase [Verrucomicrobiota bacterium]